MAICKRCHRPVPDGVDFCDDCKVNMDTLADESYLESLLSSVMDNEPGRRSVKSSKKEPEPEPVMQEPDTSADDLLADIFANTDIPEEIPETPSIDPDDLDSIFSDAAFSSEEGPAFEEEPVIDEAPVFDEEPLIDETPVFEEEPVIDEEPAFDEEPLIDETPVFEEEPVIDEEPAFDEEPVIDEEPAFEEEPLIDETPVFEEEPLIDKAPVFDEETVIDEEPAFEEEPLIDETPVIEEESLIDETPEIASLIDESPETESVSVDSLFGGASDEISFFDESPEASFADLGDLGVDEGAASLGVESLFGDLGVDAVPGISEISPEEISDVSDILASLEDGDLDRDVSDLDGDKSKSSKKLPKSMFEKLFANTGTDFTPDQIQKLKVEEDEKRKSDAEKKEQKKAAKKEAKAAKAEENAKKKEEKKKASGELKKLKKEEKAALKEKKRQEREALDSLDEYDFAQGKINKAGALILVIFFAIVAVVIIFGTDLFTYSLSIRNATVHFNKKYYNEAYYDVYGLEIKDDDVELYDRIITVMYVNKQLNSFKNFYALKEYDKALDSLIKGLWKYNRYIELARMLGIENDLNYVRSQIITELDSKFGLSEEEAMLLMAEEGTPEYSEYIYDLVDVQYSREKALK